MGVGSANLLQTYIDCSEIHSGSSLKPSFFYILLQSISAGNRRERSKVVKAINIHKYTKIFLNNQSFFIFDRSRLLPTLIEL